jgi:hypothetical protein
MNLYQLITKLVAVFYLAKIDYKGRVNMKRILFIKLTLIVFIITLLMMYAPCAYTGIWTPMTSGTTQLLRSIWGSSATDVFTVGENGTILHYNGSSWSAMTSGTTQLLRSIWGSSATDVFTVGENGTILHYNGSSWSAVASGTKNNLYGVWGSSGSDVYAVGENGTILNYNGITWSAMASGTTAVLSAIWGSSDSDVYVAKQDWPVFDVLHYNGNAWSSVPTPLYVAERIWGSSPTDIYIVGWFPPSPAGGFLPLILHFNGSIWAYEDRPHDAGYGLFFDIWGSSGSDVFAVGSFDRSDIFHYDGSAWSSMNSVPTQYSLSGVWGSSGSDVYAVGENGTILHLRLCAAESIYGEHVAETELLRAYRDNVLSKTPEGYEMIKIYYKFSPTVTKLLENSPQLKKKAKVYIDSMLPAIREKVEESKNEP